MKISIGNDHAGTDYKFLIINFLQTKNIEVINYGTDSKDSVDYPDFVHPVAKDVENKSTDLGILLCGSANGVAMTANKYQGVRAGLCWKNEIVELIRQHNNANILCIPARYTTEKELLKMVETFISTDFDGGRHQKRIDKIPKCN
jgi:ribose 5-phosphate isomerase B